jgi:hypothetical protein
MRAALDDVHAQQDAMNREMVAEYATATAIDEESLSTIEPSVTLEEVDTLPVPGGSSLSALRAAQGTQEAAQGEDTASGTPQFTNPISTAEIGEVGAEDLRRLDERNRLRDLPPVSAEQLVADQAPSPEQRTRRQRYPELFDDEEPMVRPINPGRGYED